MRVTVNDIKEFKRRGERFPMLTAYDYPTAKVLDEAGIPLILVGDSLGNVVLGYDSTVYVTMDDMIHHCRAVTRGVQNALVIGDMPFMSYQADVSDALRNAGRFLQEGGCQAVKIEGGEHMAETAHRMVQVGIPVMGHIGLTPQSVNALGGYKVQGRTLEAARQLLRGAVALEEAGCFSIVLEMVPVPLARLITEKIGVPTIGIGAGPFCDGQVQVVSDMLGLFTDFVPKHTKQYAHLAQAIRAAVGDYSREVRAGEFPTEAHSFGMKEEVIGELKAEL